MDDEPGLTRPIFFGTWIFLVGVGALVWIIDSLDVPMPHIWIVRVLLGIVGLIGIPTAWYLCVRLAGKIFGGRDVEPWR